MAKVRDIFKFFRSSYDLSDWNRSDEKLLKAVEAYDLQKAVSILNKKHVSTTKCGPKGYGPFHYACVKGYEDMVDLFISHGADVNSTNERGNSPLHLASHNGFPKIVAKLLMAGATVNFQNPYQMTALHVACNSKHETVVHILIENQANVNAYDKTQKTPIFFSCYHGHIGICKYLFEKGATLNVVDISKVTPLLTAVRQSYVDITKFLLEKGADPYLEDNFYISAVKAGQDSSSREIRKIFSKLSLTSPESKSNSSVEVNLQRETSEDLSVQVMRNLSMNQHLNFEGVQLRKDLVNTERRPISAPPPPPVLPKSPIIKSLSENIQDMVVVEDHQLSSETPENQELVDSFHSFSGSIKEESVNSLNVFPSDAADGNRASFLGLSVKDHQNRLSSVVTSDILNKWDQQIEEDDVSITSQVSEEPSLTVYDHEFSFIPGNATPKRGRNVSLRRQILALRQENNLLRETIHDNKNKLKSKEDEIKNLEDQLSIKENSNLSSEDPEILSDEDFNEEQASQDDFDEGSLDEVLSKLKNTQSMELPIQDYWQETHDKKASNLLQENMKPMENPEHPTTKMNMVSSEIVPELKGGPGEDVNQKDDVQVVQELKDFKEQHVLLQSNYNDLLSDREKLHEEYEVLEEERDRLVSTQQRLNQENEKATKQNCNLLNMKDNLKQDLEEMAQHKKNLQEEYDLLYKKAELLEKTVEKLSTSESEDEKFTVLQLDNSLLEGQCRKLLLEKDILEEANGEMKEEHDATVKILDSEKNELQAEKVRLAEKLEEMNIKTLTLQQKCSVVQQEMHFLKSQNEDRQNSVQGVTSSDSDLEMDSKIQLLENEITRLQHQLSETEKKYDEIVQNYRVHLISAIQGYIDPDVEKALYSIIELRRLEFYC